ncbi:hypothetical protein ANN_15250 [Periplaneta americana]|uniref:Uncharacterized protein n=1 Tax=Periplaneta americana TaxID=6978 RepID=A0ABQ8SG61_PERAM|nr:hypothetical protein ANN_15250 [Periplaneta americana]
MPLQFPDCNPIENLWNELNRRLRKVPISSTEELKRRLEEELGRIDGAYTSRIVASMPRWLQHGRSSFRFSSGDLEEQAQKRVRGWKIFWAKRDEVTGEWRKLHNAELQTLFSSPDIIRNTKSRRLRWAGHVARMGESRNAYRVLVGRPEGKRTLGRPRRRWEDNIKMDLREVGYDDREWINLVQDRDRWRAYVRAAMNLRSAWYYSRHHPTPQLYLGYPEWISSYTERRNRVDWRPLLKTIINLPTLFALLEGRVLTAVDPLAGANEGASAVHRHRLRTTASTTHPPPNGAQRGASITTHPPPSNEAS